jgi:enamine deaminase RidA (YjgF/YER057c/UK114 family)
MIKALSLAAALALLPLSTAVAQDARGPSEDAIEAAAEAFEARMESFGERAEAIKEDESLSETQRELRIAAVWSEYQPDVAAFTAVVSEHAAAIAGAALAEVDVDAIVAEALAEAEASGAFNAAQGIAANGAWASNDPEHMATYGLMADYAVGEALDALEDVGGQIAAAQADVDAINIDVDVDINDEDGHD